MPFIKNNEARRIQIGRNVSLMPGVNSVSDADWKEAQNSPVVKAMLSAKTLESVRTSGDAGGNVAPGDVADVDINALETNDAIRIIGETYDRALLGTWQTKAKAKELKDAITKQLAVVGVEPKK